MSGTTTLELDGIAHAIHDVPVAVARAGRDIAAVPFVGRVLLESLLRAGEHRDAESCARALADGENVGVACSFRPARLLLQDYTGVPVLVDLAAMRARAGRTGLDQNAVNPVVPVELVVDHSLQVDVAGRRGALVANQKLELSRNRERYQFLRWAEQAFDNLRVVQPGYGIVHQVNLERLATVVAVDSTAGAPQLIPDSVIGTDSHTTMVNGLGVLGWGVGGLEAESIMLGQALRAPVPPIVGVRLTGAPAPALTATDIALALTEFFRSEQVVGAWLEFTGEGVSALSAPDRCAIANMAPEYGATCAFFPVDQSTLAYLQQTGRDAAHIRRVESYCRRQRMFRMDGTAEPRFGRLLEFDLGAVRPCLAGPNKPHRRVSFAGLSRSFRDEFGVAAAGRRLDHGAIVLASITSCTNTSSPDLMVATGLLARRAVELGLRVPDYTKTSFAPGSRAVTRYLDEAGLSPSLDALGFQVVGYACATCNGGSGPLAEPVAEAIERDQLVVASVLSGNRNFEGRIHPQVQANYLASPPLVVALALAGSVNVDLNRDPLGRDREGNPVYLKDLWPSDAEVAAVVERCVGPSAFESAPSEGALWRQIDAVESPLYEWAEESTYIREPPYFEQSIPAALPIVDARVLVALGDDVTTDHISPVGAIDPDSPAGQHLAWCGVTRTQLNSYGARRGNHEVLARGTFANPRLDNLLAGGRRGGVTRHLPSGELMTVFDAATRYRDEGVPLVVLAGRNYGMGSSRDWAARGPWCLGVRVVIAESFERIHRSNLISMGILPVQLDSGDWVEAGLAGDERLSLHSPDGSLSPSCRLVVSAQGRAGSVTLTATALIASDGELQVLRRGGMLPHLLDQLAGAEGGELCARI